MKAKTSVLSKVSGAKNWIILGVAIVGGYFVYKKVIAPMMSDSGGGAAPSSKPAKGAEPAAKAAPPDMNGPAVRKGVLASSRSPICITSKTSGMQYAVVTTTDAQGYKSFMPASNGRFTRRFLCIGTAKYAEIKPA